MLEGFGDFLLPLGRQTDVERSPVPRALDTATSCSRLQVGPVITDRRAAHSLTKELSPVRCVVQRYSAFLQQKGCVGYPESK